MNKLVALCLAATIHLPSSLSADINENKTREHTENNTDTSISTAHHLAHRIRIASATGDADIAFITDPEALAFFREHALTVENIITHINRRDDLTKQHAADLINHVPRIYFEGFSFLRVAAVEENTRILNNYLDVIAHTEEARVATYQGVSITADALRDYNRKIKSRAIDYLYENGDLPFLYITWSVLSEEVLDEVIANTQRKLATFRQQTHQ